MKSSISAAALAAAFGLVIAPAAFAQAPPPAVEVGIAKLALNVLPAKKGAKLKVTTPAFKDGGDIPFENTQYRGNIFPGLQWSKGPKGTQSYLVVMQDTDGMHSGDAILHWTMFNVPASTTKLDAGMSAPPAGATYGPNVRGPSNAFMGPRPPPGPKHRYHLQVFALDTVLQGNPLLTWYQLKALAGDHVLASGGITGLGSADPAAAKPSAPKG